MLKEGFICVTIPLCSPVRCSSKCTASKKRVKWCNAWGGDGVRIAFTGPLRPAKASPMETNPRLPCTALYFLMTVRQKRAAVAGHAPGFRVGVVAVCGCGRFLRLFCGLQINIGGILAAVLQHSFGVLSDLSSV